MRLSSLLIMATPYITVRILYCFDRLFTSRITSKKTIFFYSPSFKRNFIGHLGRVFCQKSWTIGRNGTVLGPGIPLQSRSQKPCRIPNIPTRDGVMKGMKTVSLVSMYTFYFYFFALDLLITYYANIVRAGLGCKDALGHDVLIKSVLLSIENKKSSTDNWNTVQNHFRCQPNLQRV